MPQNNIQPIAYLLQEYQLYTPGAVNDRFLSYHLLFYGGEKTNYWFLQIDVSMVYLLFVLNLTEIKK